MKNTFDYKRYQLSPLQELALTKEAKIVELNKEEDLFNFQRKKSLKEKLIESLI